jgi:hypothetical protein
MFLFFVLAVPSPSLSLRYESHGCSMVVLESLIILAMHQGPSDCHCQYYSIFNDRPSRIDVISQPGVVKLKLSTST